jgi:hypothetical protein
VKIHGLGHVWSFDSFIKWVMFGSKLTGSPQVDLWTRFVSPSFWVFLGCFVFGLWLEYLCILSCVLRSALPFFLIYTTLLIEKIYFVSYIL